MYGFSCVFSLSCHSLPLSLPTLNAEQQCQCLNFSALHFANSAYFIFSRSLSTKNSFAGVVQYLLLVASEPEQEKKNNRIKIKNKEIKKREERSRLVAGENVCRNEKTKKFGIAPIKLSYLFGLHFFIMLDFVFPPFVFNEPFGNVNQFIFSFPFFLFSHSDFSCVYISFHQLILNTDCHF